MTTPNRFTKGVTNVGSSNTLGQLITVAPPEIHEWWDDFHRFDPGDWFITRIHEGATVGNETISDADGGILSFYPANADNDSTFFQWYASCKSYLN